MRNVGFCPTTLTPAQSLMSHSFGRLYCLFKGGLQATVTMPPALHGHHSMELVATRLH
jgi:hypothetical protein